MQIFVGFRALEFGLLDYLCCQRAAVALVLYEEYDIIDLIDEDPAARVGRAKQNPTEPPLGTRAKAAGLVPPPTCKRFGVRCRPAGS